jgi:hypothetical protein
MSNCTGGVCGLVVGNRLEPQPLGLMPDTAPSFEGVSESQNCTELKCFIHYKAVFSIDVYSECHIEKCYKS